MKSKKAELGMWEIIALAIAVGLILVTLFATGILGDKLFNFRSVIRGIFR
jgi:uncharacterized membrane protein (DUF485 family)